MRNIDYKKQMGSRQGRSRIGLEIYEHGGSYRDGHAPTISLSASSISTLPYSFFRPWQVQNRHWLLEVRFKIVLANNRTDIIFGINDVTFPTANNHQAGVVVQRLGSATKTNCYAVPLSSGIQCYSEASTDEWAVYGVFDIGLLKPNWIW